MKKILAIAGVLLGLVAILGGGEGIVENEMLPVSIIISAVGLALTVYSAWQVRRQINLNFKLGTSALVLIVAHFAIAGGLIVGLLYVGAELYDRSKSQARIINLQFSMAALKHDHIEADQHLKARVRSALCEAKRSQMLGTFLFTLASLPLISMSIGIWQATRMKTKAAQQ
ncbi:MAG: hypothetical protein PHR35_06360 [Kiritimatiellae bacterium]|nr:hypothetical protein [Kiritimatiellia bacterium]